ncbi:MAG TPA: DUF4129 domain-containing protein [Candidatus Eisenbacteria bacterium]|nr:DUF4129 domain-containing protein [Candidatus Eisenbacteria bacterium]
MGSEQGRPPRVPTRLETAARVVLVVALAAVAALGASGRRGLDWHRISQVPDVAVAQLLLGVVGALMCVLAVRHVLRMRDRDKQAPPEHEQPVEPRPMPWQGWLAAAAILVAGVALVWLAAYAVLTRRPSTTRSSLSVGAGPGPVTVPGSVLPLVLGLLGVLAVAALLVWVARRQAPGVAGDLAAEDPQADGTALAEAVAAAEEALEATDDTRAAIVAAYAAMEHSLARSGAGHRPSDTPTELLDRAVDARLVTRGAAFELTELFREARFSRHPLAGTARTDAERALARVSAELAVAHA